MHENFFAQGDRLVLRDRIPDDSQTFLRWYAKGEWLQYDAPWETIKLPANEEEITVFHQRFLKECEKVLATPRKMAVIVTLAGIPLGWVNRYGSERFPASCYIGIDICEDEYLNQGYGSEALQLWINHLFNHGQFHRVGIETWSFNPRMSRVAQKLGFSHEGTLRELAEWQGRHHDKEQYSLLMREWESLPWATRTNT